MHYRMTCSVRHGAIEIQLYYFYYLNRSFLPCPTPINRKFILSGGIRFLDQKLCPNNNVDSVNYNFFLPNRYDGHYCLYIYSVQLCQVLTLVSFIGGNGDPSLRVKKNSTAFSEMYFVKLAIKLGEGI